MKKNEISSAFRTYVQQSLSPTEKERKLISDVYEALQNVLGKQNCLQIGSYPRFTAITPLHDLDVLYTSSVWSGENPDPSKELRVLSNRLQNEFKNPTDFALKISTQTHSITISFMKVEEEEFSVDVVPAYVLGKNEFGQPTYMVPEVLSRGHRQRAKFYEGLANRRMGWIKSDPRGYIEVASRLNNRNNDFRKSVKFVKAWQRSCKEKNDKFELKSFHIEQIMTGFFRATETLEIYDAVFTFFSRLPAFLQRSQIPDRADANVKIDSYIDDLTQEQKDLILRARDGFLIKLEATSAATNISDLVEANFYKRASQKEQYLFDFGIPVLVESNQLRITGKVLPRPGVFVKGSWTRLG